MNRLIVALATALLSALAVPAVLSTYGGAQTGDARVERYRKHLETVVPEADYYVSKDGEYPHFRGYVRGTDGAADTLVGLAYMNPDAGHVITGYTSEIVMMVGLRPAGTMIAVSVVSHNEPYGARSIEQPRFANQFPNRRYRERLVVGDDVDGISGATITVRAATSAIRRSTRRMFREFVKEQLEAQK
ncbi:MAG: FMN-binding protein [Vicinamibacterales bacterium]|nr:hypothetical protein [Acidobacteriota bacterium]MDP6371324.1 FMN-binding protein [Vicinamibacterales bacterium]MDP6609027.1 FMN-binding protein [Vicinamibacterales bacterium]MDP7295628.1 FMN-binding protein [Vicinamibacterales bacterium]MDP7472477.1 FMN-binding protein [Vicinamibacterales bacterium]